MTNRVIAKAESFRFQDITLTGLPPGTAGSFIPGCKRRLTCWSWPGSASPWRWEWACGMWVQPGIPALGWTGRETWWPGTWSEGGATNWWGCRPGPLFLARRISPSMRRRLPLVPGEIYWNQKVILLPTVKEKNTAAIRDAARSGNQNRWRISGLQPSQAVEI